MKLKLAKRIVEKPLALVERKLRESVPEDLGVISKAAAYTLEGGGKRLRPLLVLLSADVCGGISANAVDFAAAAELLHLGSLIYDDLFDGSRLRRKRETVNHLWGDRVAYFVGTYMYQRVMRIAMGAGAPVRKLLVETADRMLQGEARQFSALGRLDLSEKEYLRIIEKKSASFIAACCRLGALSNGGVSEEVPGALGEYGMNMGMAFQIRDDILDLVADEEKLGKAVGSDLRESRATLPLIRFFRVASEEDRLRMRALIDAIAEHGGDGLREAVDLMERWKALEYSWGVAERYNGRAKRALDRLPDSAGRRALADISDFALRREY
jgi:octaprenyl-diphosphate synthase